MKVRNWSKFQHYKHRRPPWIKLHREILDDYAFLCLPLASMALAPRLWLLASDSEDGTLPDDVAVLAFRPRLTETELVAAINPMIEAGFLESASGPLAARKQDATTEKSRERVEERQREDGMRSGIKNPLLDGKRPALESEALRLVREIQAITGEDGVEIIREASSYKDRDGKLRQGQTNPSTMSDDRLLATVKDLRETLETERRNHGSA